MAGHSAALDALLNQVVEHTKAFKNGTKGAREALLATSQQLSSALMTPTESFIFSHWASPTHSLAIRVASELGLFQALLADNGSPKPVTSLISERSAEPALIARVLRHLASMGTVLELAPGTYAPTPFSAALATVPFADSCAFMTDFFDPILLKTPEFLRERNYVLPTSVIDTPFHKVFSAPPVPVFQWLRSDAPLLGKQFISMMQVYTSDRPTWWQEGYYPIHKRLIDGADTSKDSVFLVDQGSGTGHDATRLLADIGKAIPGKVVIQDRPEVIEMAEKIAAPEIDKMVHDFTTEQPVKGARAYYMHSIIHDWPDKEALEIIRSLVPAMKRGYSKLLINEFVLADAGAPWMLTSLDLSLMTVLSARERTAAEFETLIEGAGLKITGIYKHPQGLDSLIEAELA